MDGIPVTKMMQSEKDKLLKLEDEIGGDELAKWEACLKLSQMPSGAKQSRTIRYETTNRIVYLSWAYWCR